MSNDSLPSHSSEAVPQTVEQARAQLIAVLIQSVRDWRLWREIDDPEVLEAIDALIEAVRVSALQQPEQKEIIRATLQPQLRAGESDLRDDQWRPIETAPRDGTWVLVWWPYWSKRPVPAHVDRFDRWESDMFVSDEDHTLPTHWMPLPQGPQ